MNTSAQNINWAEDISCLLYTHCTSCHNPNGIAPFSLMDYTDAYNLRFSIQYSVVNEIMPPWSADPNYVSFAHERVLSPEEIQMIDDWVNEGAPEGDPQLAPIPPTYNSSEQITSPDWVAQATTYTSQASNYDEYRCFAISNPFNTDKYITALEVVPGNIEIVHHVLIFKDNTNTPLNNDNGDGYSCFGGTGSSGSDFIGGWTPGQGAINFPDGMGIKLEAGETIVLQTHYPAGSAGQIDNGTKVNFSFSDTPIIREVFNDAVLNHFTSLSNGPLNIPANTTQTFYADYTIPANVTVLSIYPHMHLIGRSINVYAVTPGGENIPLIDIPEWNFEWQNSYDYRQPIYLPAGTTIFSEAFYDNTTNNPFNPNNPPQNVSAGEATTDEMMVVFFSYLPYLSGDENIIIDTSSVSINYCDTLSVTNPISATITNQGPIEICEGESIILMASPINNNYSYQWLLDGNIIPTANSNSYSADETGDYQVIISDNTGDYYSNIIDVVAHSLPIANAGEDETICEGESIVLTASGGSNYLWSNNVNMSNNAVSPLSSTTYSVTVTDNNGCSNSDNVMVSVNAVPPTPSITEINSNTLECSINGDSYLWYLDGVLLGQTGQQITVNDEGNYTVEIIINNCVSLTSSPYNYINTSTIDISNSIRYQIFPSPNNGNFILELDEVYPELNVEITNTTGQIIFTKKYYQLNTIPIEVNRISGIYFIHIYTQNHKGSAKKIVIQ